jgi:glycosyltransferase involved in cell wall biosynthesis
LSAPLRIGIDARELLGATTGVGRYLGELLQRWTARPDAADRHFLLYTPQPMPLTFPAGLVEQRVVGDGAGTWWEQTALRTAVRSDAPNVFFAPAYTAPVGLAAPLAVTIHDISFVAHPEWFRRREGMRRRWLTRRAAERAAVIFTDSQFSRGEIEQRLRIDPGRIRVIPPGITPRTVSVAPHRTPTVLFVGSIFNRRRLPDLIAAFALTASALPSSRLVIVGDNRTWPHQDLLSVAHAHGVEGRTDLRSYVSDEELARLYREASVFAFLSEYEGFGLTPLEALAAGVPPILLDTPVAREVCGEAAAYVRQGDIDGTAATLRRLLVSRDDARAIVSRGPAVLARYSWDAAATETLDNLERVAQR